MPKVSFSLVVFLFGKNLFGCVDLLVGKVQHLFTTVRLVSVLCQPLYYGCMLTCFLFIPVISYHYFCNKLF